MNELGSEESLGTTLSTHRAPLRSAEFLSPSPAFWMSVPTPFVVLQPHKGRQPITTRRMAHSFRLCFMIETPVMQTKALEPCRALSSHEATDQAHEKDDHTDVEQNACDVHGLTGYASKAKDSRNKCENEKRE